MKKIILMLIALITPEVFATPHKKEKIDCEKYGISVHCQLDDIKQQVARNQLFKTAQIDVIDRISLTDNERLTGATYFRRPNCTPVTVRAEAHELAAHSICSAVLIYRGETEHVEIAFKIEATSEHESEYESYIFRIKSLTIKGLSK